MHGSYVAIDEGRLAALGAALDLGALAARRRPAARSRSGARLARKEAFRRALQRLYAVGPGIYELADGRHDRVPLRGSDRAAPSTR